MAKATRKRKAAKKKDVAEEQVAAEQANQDVSEQQGAESTAATAEEEALKAKKAEEESTHAKYERIKKGNLYLTDLQKLTVAELHDVAKNENIIEYSALKKQELIFRILKERIQQNGLMYGEGVLEVLPDSYGFLRNTRYNYLSSPAIPYRDKSGRRKIQKSIMPFSESKQLTLRTLICSRKRWYLVT